MVFNGITLLAITRCDWNLNAVRVARDHATLLATGWVRAGSTAARVLAPLAFTCPHLVREGTSGQPPNVADVRDFGPANDPKVWWCRPWVRALASLPGASMPLRRQYIHEVDERPDLHAVVEAVYRVGGGEAVAGLGRDVLTPRCWRAVNSGATLLDRCLLPVNHAGRRCVGQRGTIGE